MIVLGVDPGHEHSAWVTYDSEERRVINHDDTENRALLVKLENGVPRCDALVIEMVGCFGMRVGAEIFHTCRWIGQFQHAWKQGKCDLIGRQTLKAYLCGTAKATDADVRACLIERWGGKDAIKKGGPLAGIVTHRWQALAVAVAYSELKGKALEAA